MNFYRLFLTLMKQYIKRPESIILLLSLPILTLLLTKTSHAEEQTVQAACYLPGITDSADLSSLADKLVQYDGLYRFYLCHSAEEVYNDVASSHAECGYIFSENLYPELLEGHGKELVTTVASPSTTMLPVINETVYSMIFDDLAVKALEQYLSEDSAAADEYGVLYDDEKIEELYRKYMLSDDIFRFEYRGNPEYYSHPASFILLSPIRGLMAVLMLLSAFTGAISFYRLSENPVFHTWQIRISSITIPVIYTLPVMFLCICFAGLNTGTGKELLRLLVYGCACILMTLLVTLCIKKRVIFTSLLPLYILACLVFTPVFINVSTFLPALKPLSYLFLPYYYLK